MKRSITRYLLTLAIAVFTPALAAAEIVVVDPYARFMPGSMAGAAFMVIENTGSDDDRLIGVASDIAALTELHTHEMTAEGVMQMRAVSEGIAVPAQGSHALARGEDHVMLMGLSARPAQGSTVLVTLTFEHAGEIVVEIPVDNQR